MVPHYRFPGQTQFTTGTGRPLVAADGTFAWQRKGGKTTYVYFETSDGKTRSNRVVIQAK